MPVKEKTPPPLIRAANLSQCLLTSFFFFFSFLPLLTVPGPKAVGAGKNCRPRSGLRTGPNAYLRFSPGTDGARFGHGVYPLFSTRRKEKTEK